MSGLVQLKTGGFLAGFLLLVSCGGSGSSDEEGSIFGNSNSPDGIEVWQSGVFPAQAQLVDRCESPRVNSSDRAGSAQFEKMWLRSWSNDFYLWYDEIPDQNPAPFTVENYFDELVTRGLTPSGQPKDNFHFSQSTEEWQRFTQTGVSAGYGLQLVIQQGSGIPRRIFVSYVEPNSPATDAGVGRGDEILEVDNALVTVNTQSGIDTLNSGLFPSEDGELHNFVVRNLNTSVNRSVSMISDSVVSIPVTNVQTFNSDAGTIGYFLFNDHISTAEAGLVNAINTLNAANIDELVVDLRYNGGGRLVIASQLAYMVAGSQRTNGRIFEQLQFNDKYPNSNPITGSSNPPQDFQSRTLGLSLAGGQPLPTLSLDRVFVLATEDTCSASESFINSLRGIGMEVVLIGDTTCGKPYGFYPTDNCSTTYFTIQFRGVNDQNFGDYSDGFSPANATGITGVSVAGCAATDDIRQPLASEDENLLATAIRYAETGSCSATSPKPQEMFKQQLLPIDNVRRYGKPDWRKNRVIEAGDS